MGRTRRHQTTRQQADHQSYSEKVGRMRPRRRPKVRWGDDLVHPLGRAWPRVAQDRCRWKQYREGLLLRERHYNPGFSSVHVQYTQQRTLFRKYAV